ncbi:MAG: CPBP family intramembrane metalloprotease [Chloroflexi bacterium]|nr:CPBP family intramembrane metalloprotease [Chloroflexota bacterium]
MLRNLFARIGRLESTPPWGLGAGIASVMAALAALVLGFNLAAVVHCSAPANAAFCQALNFAAPPSVWLSGWTIGAVAVLLFVAVTRRTPAERAALRLGGIETSVFWVLLVSIGLAVTLDLIFIQFAANPIEPELRSLRQPVVDAAGWILAFVFMAVAQPVAEELVFRGVLQPALRQAVGAWPGYLLTSALYALFHLLVYTSGTPQTNDLLYSFLLPLVSGLIFGAVRLMTGSTRAAILSHAAFGLFAVLKVLALGA